MNFIYRIGIGSIACIAVACSKDATETVAPVAEPETVIIGCAGATGADVDVRTELENDSLSVRWAKGDEIRLWAREHKEPADASPTYVIKNVPFRFDYYSPVWSRAGFAGTISGVESMFKASKYDYFAVSPAPASVDETRATYMIPAEQTGEYNGAWDIMTAQLPDAKGLQAGDDNPSINLKFEHHIHLLKFKILSSKWPEDRPIRAVRLTFPRPVVGALTVDATGKTPDNLSALADDEGEGKTLLIKFPEAKKVKDTFYAMIAASAEPFESDIEMRIIGTTGERIENISVAGKTFAAGHSTPVDLNVKAMNNLYKTVTLKFNVVDNDRSEFAGVGNKLGVNTLGERVHTVRVIGAAGAFSNALWKSEGCSVSKDGSTLTYDDESEDGDGVFSLTFLSKQLNPDYLWPDELWDSSIISDKTLEVEYESDRALIKSQKDWKPVQTKIAAFDGSDESVNTLSVPYLFEEDFSNTAGLYEIGGTRSAGTYKSVDLDFKYFHSSGWTGASVFGNHSGCIELQTESVFKSTYYCGRLDSADILNYLKEDAANKNVKVSFEYKFHTDYDNKYTCNLYYKSTSISGPIAPYYKVLDDEYNDKDKDSNFTTNETPLSPKSYYTTVSNWNLTNCTKPTRLSWQLAGHKTRGLGNAYLCLDIQNVRVSLQ